MEKLAPVHTIRYLSLSAVIIFEPDPMGLQRTDTAQVIQRQGYIIMKVKFNGGQVVCNARRESLTPTSGITQTFKCDKHSCVKSIVYSIHIYILTVM